MIPLERKFTYEEFLEFDKNNNENLEFIDGRIYFLSADDVLKSTLFEDLQIKLVDIFE